MRYRNPVFGILAMVLSGLLWHIFKETSWAIFVERLLEEAAHFLGFPRAALVAWISEILLGGGLLWAALYFAFRVGRAERPVPPDPTLQAQREHTAAILTLAQTAATKPAVTTAAPAAPPPTFPTWIELEQRFREMEQLLQDGWISIQTGASGEHWRIAGPVSRDARDRFDAIARMASSKLFREFPDEVARHKELSLETDPEIRWYKALQYIGGRYEHRHVAMQINDDGSDAGSIFIGTINSPATASATLCLTIASHEAS